MGLTQWKSYWGAYPILDREWNEDRAWKSDLVKRLRKGGAAPKGVSVYDATPGFYNNSPAGFEFAEKHAEKANRIHSTYLTDAQIAERIPRREALKEGLREALAEASARHKERMARDAEERAARAEAQREREEWMAEYARRRAEEDRQWQQEERQVQRQRILRAQWHCGPCGGGTPASVCPEGDGYVLACLKCLRQVHVEHERIWKVMNESNSNRSG